MIKPIPILLKIIGIILVIVGLIGAYYGPLELFVFYLFSEGERFHYDGFGVGSFWFAALVVQNIGYYVVAAICIPIGYGHINYRRWALTLTKLFTWFWLGIGILLIGNLILFFASSIKTRPQHRNTDHASDHNWYRLISQFDFDSNSYTLVLWK